MPSRCLFTRTTLLILLTIMAVPGSPEELTFAHISATTHAQQISYEQQAFGGCGTPLSLASADFDEDGVSDLAVGCAKGGGGTVAIYRGDIDALYSSGTEALKPRAPFRPEVSLFPLSEPGKFLASGDFDGDGHQDLVSTRPGSYALLFLRGNGQGQFAAEFRFVLPATVVSMASGEIHRRDGLADLALLLDEHGDTRMLIFQDSAGALMKPPEAAVFPGRALAVALGSLVGDSARDLAIATGAGLVIVQGQDSTRLTDHPETLFELKQLPFSLTTLAAGNFIGSPGSTDEIALLDDQGNLHLHGPHGLTRVGIIAGRTKNSSAPTQFLHTTMSATGGDDLVLLDGTNRRIVVLSERSPARRTADLAPPAAPGIFLDRPIDRRAAATNPEPENTAGPLTRSQVLYQGSIPLAALVMRLNRDSRPDLVLLEAGATGPTALVSRGVAVYTVNSTADTTDGVCDALDPKLIELDCTLREAILAANASAGTDTIAFDIPGTPPHTIGILSDLPNVTEAVTIDGRTEPDFTGTPVVVLDGSASTGPAGFGIPIVAGSTVRGLALHRFASHSAIVAFGSSSGSLIEGNFVGTDETGTIAVGTSAGIDFATSSNNTIGGTVAEARNLVSGATLPAIIIREGSSNNLVQGNYVGLDVTGTVPLQNVGNEIAIFDSDQTTIGGMVAGSRNVVAGNSDATAPSVVLAVQDTDPLTNTVGTLIQGNYFGTDASGNVAIGSASVGIYLQDVSNNTVGGVGIAGNVIGASGLGAVRVLAPGAPATGNLIAGNSIGLGADGTTPLPTTGNGVRFSHSAANNTLTDNTITNSTDNGVLGRYDAGTGNAITGNRIFGNGLLGIDLTTSDIDPGGTTANDVDDVDTGPNGLQNFPVLSATGHIANEITGRLNSIASSEFSIEFFVNSSCDGSGSGEGAQPIGTMAVTTNSTGLATFAFASPIPLVLGEFVTATATDSTGSTSEFSTCREIVEPIFVDDFETGDTTAWS